MNDSLRERDAYRNRMYAAYASTHAGTMNESAHTHVFNHDIRPYLPANSESIIVDIGCGQGLLVRELIRSGYVRASGVDVSPEQVAIAHKSGVHSVSQGDFRTMLDPGSADAIVATDFFEHFDKYELLPIMDACRAALKPGGRVIFRVPNSLSPFGGNYRHGDNTHESWFTPRSTRQLLNAAGFQLETIRACEPVVHGAKSALRFAIWKASAGAMKTILAAETGQARGHIVTQNMLVVAYRPGS